MIESLTGQGINVRHACGTLEVSESGYYAWKGRPDPELGEWWSQISELVAERSRHFAGAADAVDGLCDL